MPLTLLHRLAVLLVLSASARLVRVASLHFVGCSGEGRLLPNDGVDYRLGLINLPSSLSDFHLR
jgi:hypothetical protein